MSEFKAGDEVVHVSLDKVRQLLTSVSHISHPPLPNLATVSRPPRATPLPPAACSTPNAWVLHAPDGTTVASQPPTTAAPLSLEAGHLAATGPGKGEVLVILGEGAVDPYETIAKLRGER